jgi:hypothetical protein
MNFADQMHMPFRLVSAYGCESAPLVDYVNHSKKVATEYVIVFAGMKRRVYNWVLPSGDSKMYVMWHGAEAFVTDEIETMLTRGKPEYGRLKQVAHTVRVAEAA